MVDRVVLRYHWVLDGMAPTSQPQLFATVAVAIAANSIMHATALDGCTAAVWFGGTLCALLCACIAIGVTVTAVTKGREQKVKTV